VAGEIAIYRQSAGGQNFTSTSLTDFPFDTQVREDDGYSRSDNVTVELAEAGHYLVIYNCAFQMDGGTYRSETTGEVVLDSTSLDPYGISSGYIRRTSGYTEAVQFAATIIDADAEDGLKVQIKRTDSNTAVACDVTADLSGLQTLKLKDDWAYFRAKTTTSQNVAVSGGAPSVWPWAVSDCGTWTSINWITEDEKDTGFTHTASSSTITLDDAGHYLICASVECQNTHASTRHNHVSRVVVNGVTYQYATGYQRGSNGCQNAVSTHFLIVESTGASQVLTIDVAQEGQSTADHLDMVAAGVTVVKLPDTGDYVRVWEDADHDHNSATFDAVDFTRESEKDTGSFTHSTSTNPSRVEVEVDDDYLFCAGFLQGKTGDNGTRKQPETRWRVNGTDELQYGGASAYTRGAQSSTDTYSGGASCGFLQALEANDYIELGGVDRGTTSDGATRWIANITMMQGVRIGSIIQVIRPDPAAVGFRCTGQTVAPTLDLAIGSATWQPIAMQTAVSPSLLITPDPAVATAEAPAVDVSFSLALTPDPAIAALGAPDVAVGLALTLAPTPATATVEAPDVSVVVGATLLTPDPAVTATSAPDVGVELGTLTLAPIPLPLEVSAPSVSIAPSLTTTPDPAIAVIENPAIGVSFGTLTVTPDPGTLVLGAPDVSVDAGQLITPESATLTLSAPAVAIDLGGVVLTPGAASVALSAPEAAVGLSLVLTPDPALWSLALPDVDVVPLELQLSPDPALAGFSAVGPVLQRLIPVGAAETSLATPAIQVALELIVAPGAAQAAVGAPALSVVPGELLVSPDPALITLVLPTATVNIPQLVTLRYYADAVLARSRNRDAIMVVTRAEDAELVREILGDAVLDTTRHAPAWLERTRMEDGILLRTYLGDAVLDLTRATDASIERARLDSALLFRERLSDLELGVSRNEDAALTRTRTQDAPIL